MKDKLERIWKEASGICVQRLWKITKTSPRTSGIPAEIRTKHLPNTSLERCRCANRLDTNTRVGSKIFWPPKRPHRPWVPPSLLTNEYRFAWGEEWSGYESDHSPRASTEVTNAWSYIFTPHSFRSDKLSTWTTLHLYFPSRHLTGGKTETEERTERVARQPLVAFANSVKACHLLSSCFLD
jgi:hypothetical protein